jgi:signal transduction histidine kinase
VHTSDSPFTADWFVVSLRWLTLLGLTISLSISGRLVAPANLLLVGLAVWNIGLSLMAGLNYRLVRHREISLGVDLLVTGLYFALAGGFSNPAAWVGILPLLSAALYFELAGALIVGLLVALTQLGVTLLQAHRPGAVLFAGIAAVLTLLLAAAFGDISTRLIKIIRKTRQEQLEAQQKKQHRENERLRAIYSLTTTLAATLNYQRVLDSALDISLKALNPDPETEWDDRLVSAVLLFSKQEALEVGSARRFTPADMRVVLGGRVGAISQALDEDKPVLLKEVRRDPELARIIALLNCKEVYCFPLRSGFNAYGVFVFGHPEPNYFTPQRLEILNILSRQAVIAIQNARLYQDLVEERDRMIEVQEEARKKLARDLHDGPTQSVSAIAMRVNMARRMLENDPQATGEELGRIEELTRRTTKEIRHMLFTLRPLVLESQGLTAALEAMASKTKEVYGQNVLVKVDESTLPNLEMGKQGVIFYIVEEAVTNARKHAKEEHIWVNLRPLDQGIALLEVQDDGVGFDVNAVNRAYDQRGSLGMVNLRERTELVNGVLNIQSTPGRGTRVQVFIPLTEEAADRLHQSAGVR